MCQSDEEPVDILPTLKKECLTKCPAPKAAYEACIKRIEAKGEGDCEGWYFDMLTCVDHCVAPKILKYTKQIYISFGNEILIPGWEMDAMDIEMLGV